jgi:subtilisin family serine protease
VTRVRHRSRWFNAISAEATPSQVEQLTGLPFVTRVDTVRRYRRPAAEPLEPTDAARERARGARQVRTALLDYGSSFDQLAQIGVPPLHDRGLTGRGVVVAIFDGGFPNLQHEVFAVSTILGERDFVDGADSVRATTDAHGLSTFSVLGGYREGELIGPAYGASFLLARTEDARSETPVEEDNWIAAVEWAHAMGADVISSSLGYLAFDRPYTSYTARDMNGETAMTTRAATMAAERGIVVVNSAGNGGEHPTENTLGAPADGRFVLSVGAVDAGGVRAPFSSVGPTADGRIKPDVVALGVRAKVATRGGPRAYGLASGTSFSCPLTAGVVALVLEAHPQYSVRQILAALQASGSQAAAPDRLLGWGLVNAVRALDIAVQ